MQELMGQPQDRRGGTNRFSQDEKKKKKNNKKQKTKTIQVRKKEKTKENVQKQPE